MPWEDLDFLGWRDPKAPNRSYLVTERDDRLMGIVLQMTSGRNAGLRCNICSLCLTTHTGGGVSLAAAHKARGLGKETDSVGEYICTDLACSLYLRGVKKPEHGDRIRESLTVEEQVARLRTKLSNFLDKLVV
jgi:hypothetical protein